MLRFLFGVLPRKKLVERPHACLDWDCTVDKQRARRVTNWFHYCLVSMEPPSHKYVLILCFVFSSSCKDNLRVCFSFEDFKEMKPSNGEDIEKKLFKHIPMCSLFACY